MSLSVERRAQLVTAGMALYFCLDAAKFSDSGDAETRGNGEEK